MAKRYPNLEKYLEFAWALTVVLVGVLVLGSLVSFWDGNPVGGVALILFAPIFYLGSMASIDLCQVLIDIEANTRRP